MLKMEFVLLEYTRMNPLKSTIDSEDQCKNWKEYEDKLKIFPELFGQSWKKK